VETAPAYRTETGADESDTHDAEVAPEPGNGNGPVDGFVVVVALPSVVTVPANAVVVAIGCVDVVSPAVVTVTGTVVADVVVDEPGCVVVEHPVSRKDVRASASTPGRLFAKTEGAGTL